MASAPGLVFTEKEFYLDEFRGRTLLFAVRHDGRSAELAELADVVRDLLRNDTRVLLLLAGTAARDAEARRTFARALTAAARAARGPSAGPGAAEDPVLELADEVSLASLTRIWRVLRAGPLLLGLCGTCPAERLVDVAQRLGGRLRVHKLVIVDPLGGIRAAGAVRQASFMDESMTEELLRVGQAEADGLGPRRPVLEGVRDALRGGVDSVNVCPLAGVARELFTYEGSGTLFTREDYCRVELLGLDDFHEVEKLIERGQQEGYLKVRRPEEIAELLFCGYGATIGRHHLAGICALETERYRRARAGEIVGLYTITRFKGEGVGIKLVQRLKAEAAACALAYLFACTTQEGAGQFFERQGFRRISPEDAPPEKWRGYDEVRRHDVAVYRLDLGASG
jgi:amino-acid N-acetyltransferase